MTRVLGIDPSLTGTGLALIDTEDRLVIETTTIGSRPATLPGIDGRVQRQARIVAGAMDFAGAFSGIALAVIEAPAYSSRTGHQHDRSGLWWRFVDRLGDVGVPIVEITTTGVKKYATGKGNADKDTVLLAVARRYPHVDVQSNDEADALILAAMGARHLGSPIDDLPLTQLAAMEAVQWTAKAVA